MIKPTYFLVVILLVVVGCATKPPLPPLSPEPIVGKAHQLKIALALGGGAAKGFAHVGVIKELESAGIVPDIVTGTSAGSIVGSLYAYGLSAAQLEVKAQELDQSNLTDLTLSTKGLIKGVKLENWVNTQVKNLPIEKLYRCFGAVATELDNGKKVVFTRGNTGRAVRASSSIPNVFQPVQIGNKYYVDGGLVSPVPVSAAHLLGADFVIAVDISDRPQSNISQGLGFLSIFNQSVNIMNALALQQELEHADVVIQPAVQSIGPIQFNARKAAILNGEVAARSMLPEIRRKLQLAIAQKMKKEAVDIKSATHGTHAFR